MEKHRNNKEESTPYTSDGDISKYRDIGRYSSSANAKDIQLGGASSFSRQTVDSNNKDEIRENSPTNNNGAIDDEAAQYSRKSNKQYSYKYLQTKRRAIRRKRLLATFCACIVLVLVGIGVYLCFPATVKVNGQELTLTYNKSVEDAINASGIKVNPGDYVAVDDSVLKKGAGHEYYVEVNGKEVTDPKTRLTPGAVVSYQNGKNIMEEYTSEDSDIKATAEINGAGSLHKFEGDGQPGTWSVMTGKESGKVAEKQTKDPGNVTVTNYNANPGTDKVIALTFDDGPSEQYTQEVLDLLKKYNAKATFFVIGENVDQYPDLVKTEIAAGHQVCTHTYDHARDYGSVDITNMPIEKRVQEVTKGQATITKVTGKEASSVCRLPGGNLDLKTSRLLAQFITAEIGWNIDTGDWKKPGYQKILTNLKLASPGDVILCHDGGGDRSQTVQALKEFLPYAADKGYKFITIDEMLQYPTAGQHSDGTKQASGSIEPSTYTNG